MRRMVDGILELFGRIDILVNNAGMVTVDMGGWEDREFLDMDDAAWDRDLEMNLGTAYNVTKAALPGMVERGWGRIVMVSSVTGPVATAIGSSGYAAAKAGMDGLMRGLAIEVARHGVTVNSVLPGWIATGSQTAEEDVAGRYTPVGRSGTPEEVGELIAFLASDRASYLTGQAFRRRRREHDPGAEGPLASSTAPGRHARFPLATRGRGGHRGRGGGDLRQPRALAAPPARRAPGAQRRDPRPAVRPRPSSIEHAVGGGRLPTRTGRPSPAARMTSSDEVLVYGRSLDGEAGHLVVTPLVLDGRRAPILVVRGWVPFAMQAAPVRAGRPSGRRGRGEGFLVPDEGDGSTAPDADGVDPSRWTSEGIASSLPYDVFPLPLQLAEQTPRAAGVPADPRAAARALRGPAPVLRDPVVLLRRRRRRRRRDPAPARSARRYSSPLITSPATALPRITGTTFQRKRQRPTNAHRGDRDREGSISVHTGTGNSPPRNAYRPHLPEQRHDARR